MVAITTCQLIVTSHARNVLELRSQMKSSKWTSCHGRQDEEMHNGANWWPCVVYTDDGLKETIQPWFNQTLPKDSPGNHKEDRFQLEGIMTRQKINPQRYFSSYT